MSTETSELVYDDLTRAPEEVIARLRDDLLAGAAWPLALLEAVKRWRVPHEVVEGRHYYYLIGGEAFDWLLLAERLLEAAADLVPADEHEALIFGATLPPDIDAETFKRMIGPAKYRAHLNFLYGVTVEEALQLSVEDDVHKEIRCRAWGSDQRVDESVFQRVYLKSHAELLAQFREQRSLPQGETISFSELKEFTYWLFKYRLRQCDQAKVASDTSRGLNKLAQLDALRRRGDATVQADAEIEAIDTYAV